MKIGQPKLSEIISKTDGTLVLKKLVACQSFVHETARPLRRRKGFFVRQAWITDSVSQLRRKLKDWKSYLETPLHYSHMM
jgi:hypothetical protein